MLLRINIRFNSTINVGIQAGEMKIGILGLGLIGGSLGFDLRSQGHYVLGVSRRESTCQKAMEIGSVDQASIDFSLLVSNFSLFMASITIASRP